MILFLIGERVVGTTRSLRQRTIERILDRLASQHIGQTVTVQYPPDYEARLQESLRRN